jgi:23S rRNA pseudouridine2605 synthase
VANTPHRQIGLARVINKAGHSSRSQAERLVRDGKVSLDGKTILDPEFPTRGGERILIDGALLETVRRCYLMMNKPRGLVTSAQDERGRDTVYSLLEGMPIPHVGPVGRLDKASEGLLLFTNDTVLANSLLDPMRNISKTYHVQVRGIPQEQDLLKMISGIMDDGELIRASQVTILRQGESNAWIEVLLTEGKNREIRRMLDSLGFETLRLMRIAMGPLVLGDLAKGAVRELSPDEIRLLQIVTRD